MAQVVNKGGRPKLFKGVDFEWDPEVDKVESRMGYARVMQARAAGASLRDCEALFGVSRYIISRLLRSGPRVGYGERTCARIWVDMIHAHGGCVRELGSEDGEPLKGIDPEWLSLPAFTAWLMNEEDRPGDLIAVIPRARRYPLGPDNYRLVYRKGPGRRSGFTGVKFNWDPDKDNIDSEYGLKCLLEARTAGASVRDCAAIFGMSKTAMAYRIQEIESERRAEDARPRHRDMSDILGA